MKRTPAAVALALVVAVCSAAALAAQAPTLRVSAPIHAQIRLANGIVAHSWEVLLTNDYSAPVTAYVVAPSADGRTRTIIQDTLPGDRPLSPPLPPGETASIVASGGGHPTPTVTDVAVIYADGATAGRPEAIAALLHVRAVYLAELPLVIKRLNAIGQDPGSDRNALTAHFQRLKAAEAGLLNNPLNPHQRPKIALSLITTLTAPSLSNQSVQADARSFIAIFSRWHSQLEHSLPKLPTISFPEVP